MADFVRVPPERLPAETLAALLEEYVSRDGTDYGRYDISVAEKRSQLQSRLTTGDLQLLYDADSEHWDLVDKNRARELLAGEE
ncbi:MAG: YheU family protein [Chromatocurvus sp.]